MSLQFFLFHLRETKATGKSEKVASGDQAGPVSVSGGLGFVSPQRTGSICIRHNLIVLQHKAIRVHSVSRNCKYLRVPDWFVEEH